MEDKENKLKQLGKKGLLDTFGNVTYSLAAGGLLDYWTGLDLTGIIASRLSATKLNILTGAAYGQWREGLFNLTKTSEDYSKLRKGLVDLLAFNTFQVPVYATAVGIGSLVSEGQIDWDKIKNGAENLAMVSPLIGPTLGWYMDGLRRMSGLKAATMEAKIDNGN